MSWQDRLAVARYTSPGGRSVGFDYEDVGRSVTRRTTAFEFPDTNGTFVQQLGRSSRKYALRMFISGADYDLAATQLEDMLDEEGEGVLDHPIYGRLRVVVFGEVTRKDNLVSGANQAVVEATFFQVEGIAALEPGRNVSADALAAVGAFNDSTAQQFGALTESGSAVQRASTSNEFTLLLDFVRSGLSDIAAQQADVNAQFTSIYDSINASIDVLVADPVTLASQTILMIESPSRANTLIAQRLEGYQNLLNAVIDSDIRGSEAATVFQTRDLFAVSYVASVAVSALNNEFITRSAALDTAATILAMMGDLVVWRDSQLVALDLVDTGGSYRDLLSVVSLVASFLVESSFQLKKEKWATLTTDTTVLSLVAEFYGNVDENLDLFINSNALTGSEILMVPKGREVVYYV